MLAYLFVLLAVAVRFFPHPWTFTPVAASLLFFAARGDRRRIWVPFAVLAVSDLLLNKFVYAYPFSWDQLASWVWYAAVLWLGTSLRENARPLRVIGAALASSVSFFLISNLVSWAAFTDLYPRSLAGVMMSYTAAIPFFRQEVEGDLLFACAMFATPAVVHYLSGALNKSAGDDIAAA